MERIETRGGVARSQTVGVCQPALYVFLIDRYGGMERVERAIYVERSHYIGLIACLWPVMGSDKWKGTPSRSESLPRPPASLTPYPYLPPLT